MNIFRDEGAMLDHWFNPDGTYFGPKELTESDLLMFEVKGFRGAKTRIPFSTY